MLNKFVNWLNKKDYNPILEGVFGSWTYHVPEDRQQQMYDFYMLEYLLPPGIHMYLRPIDFGGEDTEKANALQNKEREEKGLPPDTRHYGDMSMTAEDKFYYALYEVGNKLLPALKKELLESVMFSISAELRHLYDGGRNSPPKTFIQTVKKELGEKPASLLRNYTIALKNIQNPETAEIMDRVHVPATAKGSDEDYITSYKAMRHAGGTDEEWAKLASWLFHKAQWRSSFGGPAWGGIADGWLHLNDATLPNKIIAYIDHVYDLQHNTGSVFTKLKSYRKNSSYEWIQKSLDHKRDLVSPHEMFEHISPSMRELAKIGVKLKTGKTFLDFEKEWPEILKKKTEMYNQMQRSKYEKNKAEHEKKHPNDSYWESKPQDITPEQYASQNIENSSVTNPVTGKYGPALYSMGQVNKEYWEKINKNKPVPQPTYTGTPINKAAHPADVDIGDKVKIIGGSSGYVGQTGTVIEKTYKYDFPYFNVEFSDKSQKAFKRHRFEVVEKANVNKLEVGDNVIIKVGIHKDKKGVVKSIGHDGFITVDVKLPHETIEAKYKNSELRGALPLSAVKKDDSAFKVDDPVIITHGNYKDSKGVLKIFNGHSWFVHVKTPGGNTEQQWYSPEYLKKDDSAATPDAKSLLGFKVGDPVIIKYGANKGKKGTIARVKPHDDPYPYVVSFTHQGPSSYSSFDLSHDYSAAKKEYKVGDPVIITKGDYKDKKGIIKTKTDSEGIWIIAVKTDLDSKDQDLYYSQEDFKPDDTVDKKSSAPTPEVGNTVKIIKGGFEGFTGTIKEKHGTTYASYTITLDLAWDGKEDSIFSPDQFKVTGNAKFKIGDSVKVTGGEHKGITGVIKTKITGDNLFKIQSGSSGYEYLVHANNLGLIASSGQNLFSTKFKVGDFIKVTGGLYIGIKGQITKIYDDMTRIKFGDGHEAPVKVANIELSKKEFKIGDPVKIINGPQKGMVGTIKHLPPVGALSNLAPGYTVLFPSGGSYAINADDMELAPAPTPVDTGAEVIKSLKNSYATLNQFLFPMDLKVARALIYTMHFYNNYPLKDALTKVNSAVGSNYSPGQLFDIEKTYQKEMALQKYFDSKPFHTVFPLTQEKAHEIIVKDFHDAPGKPFLDKKTIMDIESKIENGDKIPAIKLAREALGWNLKAAKSYVEYLTYELAMSGIHINKLSG